MPIFAQTMIPSSSPKVTEHLLLQLRRTGHVGDAQMSPKKSRFLKQRGEKRVRFFTGFGSGIYIWVFPKIVDFPPKSSILIGFSIIFTLHFGDNPYFRKHPYHTCIWALVLLQIN